MVKQVIFWDKKSKRKTARKKFIKKIHIKKGALSKQLGIPIEEKIPFALLNKIIATKLGQTIKNPTKIGNKRIKVTRLLERRSILVRSLKRIAQKRKMWR